MTDSLLLSLHLIPARGLGHEFASLLAALILLELAALLLSPRALSLPERDHDPCEPCRTSRDLDAIRLEMVLRAARRDS